MFDPAIAPLAQHLAEQLQDFRSARVAVAFSGGVDSTALLLAAAAVLRDTPLRALHVNHHCSTLADDWQAHCLRTAVRLGVELRVLSVPAGRLDATSSETRMRAERYALLEAALHPGEVLLLAHHRDDQAEGALLALLRGGSIQEMAGAPARRRLGLGWIMRPFLQRSRKELQQCVEAAGATWVNDPANQDSRHPRSMLRHQVLPILGRHWPDPARSIAASARRLQEAARALAQAIDGIVGNEDIAQSLPLRLLQQHDAALALAILRYWLDHNDVRQPPDNALRELLRQVLASDHDTALQLDLGAHRIRRYRDRLWLVFPQPAPARDLTVTWESAEQVLPAQLGRMRWSGGTHQPTRWPRLEVRFAVPGVVMQVANQTHHRPLKKLFQEAGVPPWERLRTPLVFFEAQPVMIGNLYKSASMTALERQLGASAQWQRLDRAAGLG